MNEGLKKVLVGDKQWSDWKKSISLKLGIIFIVGTILTIFPLTGIFVMIFVLLYIPVMTGLLILLILSILYDSIRGNIPRFFIIIPLIYLGITLKLLFFDINDVKLWLEENNSKTLITYNPEIYDISVNNAYQSTNLLSEFDVSNVHIKVNEGAHTSSYGEFILDNEDCKKIYSLNLQKSYIHFIDNEKKWEPNTNKNCILRTGYTSKKQIINYDDVEYTNHNWSNNKNLKITQHNLKVDNQIIGSYFSATYKEFKNPFKVYFCGLNSSMSKWDCGWFGLGDIFNAEKVVEGSIKTTTVSSYYDSIIPELIGIEKVRVEERQIDTDIENTELWEKLKIWEYKLSLE